MLLIKVCGTSAVDSFFVSKRGKEELQQKRFGVEGEGRCQCTPMMNKPSSFQGLNIRIPIGIPIKGKGFWVKRDWPYGSQSASTTLE